MRPSVRRRQYHEGHRALRHSLPRGGEYDHLGSERHPWLSGGARVHDARVDAGRAHPASEEEAHRARLHLGEEAAGARGARGAVPRARRVGRLGRDDRAAVPRLVQPAERQPHRHGPGGCAGPRLPGEVAHRAGRPLHCQCVRGACLPPDRPDPSDGSAHASERDERLARLQGQIRRVMQHRRRRRRDVPQVHGDRREVGGLAGARAALHRMVAHHRAQRAHGAGVRALRQAGGRLAHGLADRLHLPRRGSRVPRVVEARPSHLPSREWRGRRRRSRRGEADQGVRGRARASVQADGARRHRVAAQLAAVEGRAGCGGRAELAPGSLLWRPRAS
mmetsp:Transcript_113/g.297  ORF Transcript_113/g.297 Transcript_113/m.297 type:complete len:334 (+) Transcript_113:326-1327(+)